MERFKAVEKAMKTKAYSKEGLSAATKLDPKDQAKVEASEFLSSQVDELEQQIETLEAEGEAIQATVKKGKAHGAKADRMAEIERIIERHKWHQAKLELVRRSLENGGVDPEQVTELEESIRYYVTDNQNDDFMEDDTMYDDLNLHEEEDAFGAAQDGDKGSSQDAQSIQDDIPEPEGRSGSIPGGKARPVSEAAASSGRRPSAQLKSPLPTLATLHTPLATIGNGSSSSAPMKPASVPTRPAGEGLKYASAAAAAAAASDRTSLGIAPLPPPPGAVAPPPAGASSSSTIQPPAVQRAREGSVGSPSMALAQPAAASAAAAEKAPAQQPAQQPPQPASIHPPSAPAVAAAATAAVAVAAVAAAAAAAAGAVAPPKPEKSSRASGKAPAAVAAVAPPPPAEPAESSKGTAGPPMHPYYYKQPQARKCAAIY